MITISYGPKHLYIGQRVGAPIHRTPVGVDTRTYYIGNIVRFEGGHAIVEFDFGKAYRIKKSRVSPVICFLTEKNGLQFEDLNLTNKTIIDLFSDNTRMIEFGTGSLVGLWSYINHAVFDGLLPRIKIHKKPIASYARFAASYTQDKVVIPGTARIIISDKVRKPFEVLTAMSHEMVHQYQSLVERQFVDGPEAHDSTFFRWAPKIRKELGVKLGKTESFGQNEYEDYDSMLTYYVLLREDTLQNGQKYIGTYSTDLNLILATFRKKIGENNHRYIVLKTNDLNIPALLDKGYLKSDVVHALADNIILFDSKE